MDNVAIDNRPLMTILYPRAELGFASLQVDQPKFETLFLSVAIHAKDRGVVVRFERLVGPPLFIFLSVHNI